MEIPYLNMLTVPIRRTQAIFHPEQYHGWGKTERYFEGWYYKAVNATEDKAFAFIFGIAMEKTDIHQAFIQVLDGKMATSEYHKFDIQEFSPNPKHFEVRLGKNLFLTDKIQLDLPTVTGELKFNHQVSWPNRWYSPGIMGPFSFVPFMECYHGILSMDHVIQGSLTVQGETIDFTDGRGYMEKDWGRSFPSGYIWMQSNHFTESGISVKASVAKIPWLGSSFVGFIAGVWLHDRLIEFTTYNFTKLRKSFADQEKVEVVMENGNYRLELLASRSVATQLASPILGFMDGRIEESMTSQIEVMLFDKKSGQMLLHDVGRNAALEVAGNIEEIFVL